MDFGLVSLEGTSSGTRQGQGVGDVLLILDVDLEVISFEGTSTRVNMGSRQGQEVGGDVGTYCCVCKKSPQSVVGQTPTGREHFNTQAICTSMFN